MPDDNMLEEWQQSLLYGSNATWIEALYESYLDDPNSVDSKWRKYFELLPRVNGTDVRDIPHSQIKEYFKHIGKERAFKRPQSVRDKQIIPDEVLQLERKQVKVLQLINSFRFRGHQKARLNPLVEENTQQISDLELDYYEFTPNDLQTVFDTGSLVGEERATLNEIYNRLKTIYCGSIGAEYMHITETEEKRWLQQQLESTNGRLSLNEHEKKHILGRLSAAEGLEQYLHSKYVGQKRFSLEGAESLIVMLDEMVQRAGQHQVKECVIGMAHRGRLNVLVNIIGKTPSELFAEFEGRNGQSDYSGDVKYHMGFSSDVTTPGGPMHLTLAFNPSHLEIVSPVVEGSVRARQDRRGDKMGDLIVPIQIHGDAAFAGQGVVMETFQMSQTRGYSTKGTVHIVVNNQIGFTTSTTKDARSTYYCTDVAKMVNAPILHVNGDDPEAVVFATQIALDYRIHFKKDVVIDLVCYRRHGHNEADEPSATQPMMYHKIRALPSTRQLYADRLVEQGTIDTSAIERFIDSYRDELEAGHSVLPNLIQPGEFNYPFAFHWERHTGSGLIDDTVTAIELDRLKDLAQRLEQLPDEFELHSRVAKIRTDRHKMAAGALPCDWGFGETLAYASLLEDGFHVRLSGQDAGRGTFFHRHAVWHNQLKAQAYVPLRNLGDDVPGNFLVIDSLLSEEAVLAFEYGYASTDPKTLVIWEAQFGDFANGAQVVIDQFISAGEQKWGRHAGLTLFLPHGYEGQGPEHSSARLERFLQLCAQNNIQVCVPTTPAQVFHLLRRQMVRQCRKPLVVMTPKSLLRHKMAVSQLEAFTEGKFYTVVPDPKSLTLNRVKRAVLCSGKVFYDLYQYREELERDDVALLRIEQLYPFPLEVLKKELHRYVNLEEVVWCQEEPRNQGAWYIIRHHLEAAIKEQHQLYYAGRSAAAAPAAGLASVHAQQQRELVEQAFAKHFPY